MSVVLDDVSALFPGPDAWDGSPYDPPLTRATLTGFDHFFSDALLLTNPIPATSEPDTVHTPMDVMQISFNDLPQPTGTGGRPAVMHFRHHTGILPQSSWVSLNAPRSRSTDLSNTISPLQTCFDSQSFSNASVSADGHIRSSTASSFDRSNDDTDEDAYTQKRRRRSDTTHNNGTHFSKTKPATGRRRASEDVEPGSARAIYLEKNRKAASKCRNKQKAQQEALVESAREYERRNQLLKAEVDLLKADMRDLMELVGKHADCPDKRLQTYVRREADRLAAKDKNDVVAQLLSAGDGISPIQA